MANNKINRADEAATLIGDGDAVACSRLPHNGAVITSLLEVKVLTHRKPKRISSPSPSSRR